MDRQKFNQILKKLWERTEDGKLEWETTVNKNTFLVALKDTAVSITKIDGNYFSFDFRNETGNIVESVLVSNSEEQVWEFATAQSIFEHTREQIDKIADRILEQLAA